MSRSEAAESIKSLLSLLLHPLLHLLILDSSLLSFQLCGVVLAVLLGFLQYRVQLLLVSLNTRVLQRDTRNIHTYRE